MNQAQPSSSSSRGAEGLTGLLAEAEVSFAEVHTRIQLEELRIKFLGEKSTIQALQKNIAQVPKAERPEYGRQINAARRTLEGFFGRAREIVEQAELEEQLQSVDLDISLPGLPPNRIGARHPLTLIAQEILEIFGQMSFVPEDSPEVESEYYNFTALNTPEDHPARDEQDTFYTNIAPQVILRSHVSPFQVRVLERKQLPLRCVSLGRVYRNEEINPRKLPFFHQLEILCVDREVNFAHLKWTLQTFFNLFFGGEIPIRLRPDFFPFTEPSAEVDAQCPFCKGEGCPTCGHKGWLELLGCGMVDPNVLQMAGVNPQEYSGFAAGAGVERFAMIKYNISDIRELYSGDLRLLEQFA